MKGFGTVVTGTLISGTIRKEQELEVHPGRQRLRVRGVQVHGAAAEEAIAGQRTALNLAAVETSELARGMMLTPPALFQPVTRLSVTLDLLRSAKPLRDRARVHLHVFTSETIAEVSLLGVKVLQTGESVIERLRLEDPQLLLPGDRFIIRQFSPVITIGGGRVLDAAEEPRRTKAAERLAFLQSIANGGAEESLAMRVVRRGDNGLSVADAVGETGLPPARVESRADVLVKAGKLGRLEDVLISSERVASLGEKMSARVEQFQKLRSSGRGHRQGTAARRQRVARTGFSWEVLDALVKAKKIEVKDDVVHVAGKGVVLRATRRPKPKPGSKRRLPGPG